MASAAAIVNERPSTSSGPSPVPTCYLCKTPLPMSRDRRTLDANSTAEMNRKALTFLQGYVTEVACPVGERRYLCKPCFSRIDKARRSVELAEVSINDMRAQVRGNSPSLIDLRAVEREIESSQTPEQSSDSEVEVQGGDGGSSDVRSVGSKRGSFRPMNLNVTPRTFTSPVTTHSSRRTIIQTSSPVVKVNSCCLF